MMQFAQYTKAHFQTTTNKQAIQNNSQSTATQAKTRGKQEVDMEYDKEQRCSAEWQKGGV